MKTLFNLYLSLNESKKLFWTLSKKKKKRKLKISSYWSSFLLIPQGLSPSTLNLWFHKLSWISSSLSLSLISVSSCGKTENNKTALRILHTLVLLYFLVFNNFNNFLSVSKYILIIWNKWLGFLSIHLRQPGT